MNLKEYQEQSTRTCPDLGSLEQNLLHMKLGIFTEVGEILDIFKKNLAYEKPIDYINLGEEIADVCWYAINEDRLNKIIYTETDVPVYYSMHPLDDRDILDSLLNFQSRFEDNILSLMFNIASTYPEQGLDFYKLLDNNIAKLKVRFPDKFDAEKALNRDLESERKKLEE